MAKPAYFRHEHIIVSCYKMKSVELLGGRENAVGICVTYFKGDDVVVRGLKDEMVALYDSIWQAL
jgi:hypothetical protein